jgi:predicted deacylase
MGSKTLIASDVDYDRPGKQQGYLQVPFSDNEAGWAKIYIPITTVKNGEGPTLLVTGGTHGDEFEGCVALMDLAYELRAQQIQGRVIIVPALNLPAVQAGTRLSPLDGQNLNRAYPGKYSGTLTDMIAHYVSSVLLPMTDVFVDIHSGGKSLYFLRCCSIHRVPDGAQFQRMLAVALAWGAPYVFIYADVAGEGLLATGAERMGKVVVGTEMGGGGQCDPEALRMTRNGIHNVMIHLGLLDGTLNRHLDKSVVISAPAEEDYRFAPAHGIYESFFEVGENIEAGTPVGQVHFPERFDRPPERVVAAKSGILVARRFPGTVRQGDCVAVIARPVEEA